MKVPAYAIAYIQDVDLGPEIIEYIEKIEATLAPYGGRSSCTAARSSRSRASGPVTW